MTGDGPSSEIDERRQRRDRLVGRLVIIGLALLVAAYLVPLFLHR
ncbi:MAG TPA: hypothetical protein VFE18_07520 [Phenylobacterium sp.]|nr:hypothetical protein [Phenylobacterium sp.]HZZ68007.1 hypothetical protein [Phenylobacterium sp.]